MRVTNGRLTRAFVVAVMVFAAASGLTALEQHSPRLDRAKDHIADERWALAIGELRAAAADAKEANRDEALFWLAHSYNQARDSAAAVATIQRLQQEFPKSRWVKPAQSLKIEIAQRLRRTDLLWAVAVPVPPPPPTPPPTPTTVALPVSPGPAIAPPVPPGDVPAPRPRPVPRTWPSDRRQPMPAPVRTPPPASVWVMMHDGNPDVELRIQALGSLILTDSEESLKVIPMLRDIALEASNPGQARRALFALAQSRRPEARSTVVEVAKTGSEPVQIEAVRALTRFRGADVAPTLLQVYTLAGYPVKYQIVHSFGLRAETASLLHIARSEGNAQLRDTAIVTLGQTPGGSVHLRAMYDRAAVASKRPIIVGLFNARDVDGLIRIHKGERQISLRREVVERLRLLGTPQAKQYLEQLDEK
jgi:hypothetical protein